MDGLTVVEIALRLGAAAGLGALVGLERERKHRPAGFRTMILISLGSAGFVLTALEAIASVPFQTGQQAMADARLPNGLPVQFGQSEISRVLQGLIGGIGFLGAGAVIQNKKAVRGLTTAAAVWVTAAIGAGCSLGLYKLAGILGVGTLFTLIILEHVEEHYFPDPETLETCNGTSVQRVVIDEDGRPLDPKE